MPFVRVNDLVVHYDFAGPGGAPVIAIGNSLGTSFHMWDDNIAALSERYRVLRHDMRGHGLTSASADPARTSIDILTDDLVGLLDVLGINRVRYVGLSIGGMIGQHFAATHPDRVEAVVLCATGNQLGSPEVWNTRIATVEAGGLEAIADATMQRWFTQQTRSDRADTVAGIHTMLTRTSQSGYLGGSAAVRDGDLRADNTRITAPTLIISGTDDAAAPPAAGEAMHAAIAGSQLVVLENAAHILNMEHPARVDELILGFFADPARGAVGARA